MRLAPSDVVVVPFPYAGRPAEKRRPALVVSHADLPARLGRVRVAMITSVPYRELGDAALGDPAAAGLPVASTLRASQLATLDAAPAPCASRGACRTRTRGSRAAR